MIYFQNLSKSYGKKKVFENLAHRFGCGLHALKGHNGIGKSTLLALLCGAEERDVGEIRIDGISLQNQPFEAKRRLSYVPDKCPVYPFITGRHYLELVARAKKRKIEEPLLGLLADFGITNFLDTRFGAMSLGTQKKFMLAAAKIGEPGVYLIDEPTNGLDESARKILAQLFIEESNRAAVLFSTHDDDFIASCSAQKLELGELIAQSCGSSAL